MKKRKKKKLSQTILMLMAEQKRDQQNPDAIDNTYDPRSEDIYHRRKRTRGSGFYRR